MALPPKVSRELLPCMAEDGSLWFVTLTTHSNTIEDAIALARLRDSLPASRDRKIIKDGVSIKFGEVLYPRVCRFERGLRAAMTLAICVDQDNFDSDIVANLESHSGLGSLNELLFEETEYKGRLRIIASLFKEDSKKRRLPSKASLVKDIEESSDQTLWESLFGDGDLLELRKNYEMLWGFRDDVMHFHTISLRKYRTARKNLDLANRELDEYIERMRANRSFDERAFERANSAVSRFNGILSWAYLNHLSDLIRNLKPAADILKLQESVKAMQAFQSTKLYTDEFKAAADSLASQADTIKGIRDNIARVQKLTSQPHIDAIAKTTNALLNSPAYQSVQTFLNSPECRYFLETTNAINRLSVTRDSGDEEEADDVLGGTASGEDGRADGRCKGAAPDSTASDEGEMPKSTSPNK